MEEESSSNIRKIGNTKIPSNKKNITIILLIGASLLIISAIITIICITVPGRNKKNKPNKFNNHNILDESSYKPTSF